MGMMDEMMGAGEGTGMPMMPQCLSMMLPNMAKETRIDFVLKMVVIPIEQGSVGMSDEEKEDLVAKVIAKVKT